MKKVTLFIFLMVLLCPVSSFAKNPFRFLSPKKKNFTPICHTLPASAPVTITLSEIGYDIEKTYVEKRTYGGEEIKTEPARIYLRHAVKNKGKKTITACNFQVKIYYSPFVVFEKVLYEGNIFWHVCNIRPGKSQAETWKEIYKNSNEWHDNIRKVSEDFITSIVYKVYFVKYSDGTSEGFNPDS